MCGELHVHLLNSYSFKARHVFTYGMGGVVYVVSEVAE
jgi:hypothetical protein